MRCPTTLVALALSNLSSGHALLMSPTYRRAATIDKPVIKPPFSEAAQEKDLKSELQLVAWTHEHWDVNWLPQACVTEARHTGFRAMDFEAVEVWFEDCAASWTICRHMKADESLFYILDTLSRIPVGLRQYIANAVVVPRPAYSAVKPPKDLPFAYARPGVGVLTFMPSFFTPGTILHETGHLLDALSPTLHSLTGTGTGTGPSPETPFFSSSPLWLDTLANDTALPTPYARSNRAEAFADALRWAVSDMVHPGGLGAYSAGWEGCKGQIRLLEDVLEGVIWPKGGRCVGKVRGSMGVRVDGDVDGDEMGGGRNGTGFGGQGGGRRRPGVLAEEAGVVEIGVLEGMEGVIVV